MSTEQESVSEWIRQLKAHPQEDAAQKIYERYIGALVGRARAMLGRTDRRVADEEDIAVQAIHGLFEGINKGRFPRLSDRHDLWQILMRLVRCRVIDHWRRYQGEAKRVQGESALDLGADTSSESPGMDRVSND